MPKHEITGHDVNHTADDIGEEINGIGFIPTPAMVTKRSEWRRRDHRMARSRIKRSKTALLRQAQILTPRLDHSSGRRRLFQAPPLRM
jgi:hypothetical protein